MDIDATTSMVHNFEHGVPPYIENKFDNSQKRQAMLAEFNPFTLSWSHYLILMRIKNDQERRFYEIEATNQQWGYRQLQREYGSSLYERLALSRDKEGVMNLSKKGQIIENPRDVLKNPFVLEFLGMEESTRYSETELEQALINNLQKFLLELGKGFLFEARQKRFTFDEDHFKVDKIPYGESYFEGLRRNDYYYVDKTHFIRQLEQVKRVIHLRPGFPTDTSSTSKALPYMT